MVNRAFKDRLYGHLATVGQALANGHRLELIDLLAQGERTVDELAGEARLSLANASQHLQVLHRAHLVSRRREGVQVRYRLADPSVMQLWVGLRDLAADRVPDVAQVVAEELDLSEGLEAVGQVEIERQLSAGHILLLDVRPRLEYLAGHVAGSISVPLEELEGHLAELPRGREIVAYCRGPYCSFANEAVRRLRAAGFRARRMALGYPEWTLAARPVRTGAA